MRIKQELLEGVVETNVPNDGEQGDAICENHTRNDRHPSQLTYIELSEVRLTSLTPPIDTPPQETNTSQTLSSSTTTTTPPSPQSPAPTNTAITNTTPTTPSTTTYNDRYQVHNDNSGQRHNHRTTTYNNSRDRCDELKLSEQQWEHLSLIIGAIKDGNFERFCELLCRKAYRDSIKNLLNVFVDGQTTLHYSLIYGRSSEWCKQLIMNGANPNQTNRAGWHPIHLAAYSGSPETMLYLIDCFAE